MQLGNISVKGMILATMFVGHAAFADGHADVAAAIEAVDQEFENALAAGSAERLAGVYTKDGQALPPNSAIVEGQEDLVTFWQGAVDAGFGGAELETIELEVFGENAVQVGRYTLTMQNGDVADTGKLMILWKVEDGEWRWHRDIWNSSNPAN